MHMIPGVICCSFAIVIDFRSDLRPTSILLWPRPFLQYDIQKIIPKGREFRSWQRPFQTAPYRRGRRRAHFRTARHYYLNDK